MSWLLEEIKRPGTWIEILILWAVIYVGLRFLRRTRGFGILRGLVFFILAAVVGLVVLDAIFDVEVLKHLLAQVAPFLVLMMVILFQPELRQGISRFGQTGFLGFFSRPEQEEETIRRVSAAAQRLAKERTGAIIAFERTVSLAPYQENAARVDAPVSAILLESIFFHGNPLHDGGVIVRGNQIVAAACIFPLTSNPEVQRRLGTRHRAAIGLTEETDAVAVVVSEESGQISLAFNGTLFRQVPFDQLEERLAEMLEAEAPRKKAEAPAETKIVDGGETVQVPAQQEATVS